MSQDSLADRLGRRQSHIARLETGAQEVTIRDLIKIAAEVRRDPPDLFARALTADEGHAGQRRTFEAIYVSDLIVIARAVERLTQVKPLDLFASLVASHYGDRSNGK